MFTKELLQASDYPNFLETYGNPNWREDTLAEARVKAQLKQGTILPKPESQASKLKPWQVGAVALTLAGIITGGVISAEPLAENAHNGGHEFTTQYLGSLPLRSVPSLPAGLQADIKEADPGLANDPQGMQDVENFVNSKIANDKEALWSGNTVPVPVIPGEQNPQTPNS